MLFLDTQAVIIRQGECLLQTKLTQQPAEIRLVTPFQPLLMGRVQGGLTVARQENPLAETPAVRYCTRLILRNTRELRPCNRLLHFRKLHPNNL